MVTFGTIVYTLVSRFLLLLLIIITIVPTIILIFLVPQKYRYNRLYFFLSGLLYRAILRLSLLPITVVGKDNLPKGPAIYVANHVSSLDIPVLGSLVNGRPHFWLAMKWLTNFWIFRLFLPRMAVLVDMSTPHSGVRSLIKIIQLAKKHAMSVMIFPEGQRYTDGKVHDFFGGFALLAKKTGFLVVPVKIFNLEKVYPPNSFWVHYHPVKIVIGEPMYMQQDEIDEVFKERVHQWFVNQEQ